MAHPVFLPTVKVKEYGEEIKVLMEKGKVIGDIGLEIECEGNKFYKNGDLLNPWWEYHDDNSLRGQDNAEYVLAGPIDFDEVPTAIKALWGIFKTYGTVLDESNRTSVHVHLNVGRWNVNRLASFTAMWFALEEILAEWAGDHRVGNLFCLRGKDAPNIVQSVKKFVQLDGQIPLHDGLHYAGLNIQALKKFGSLENRYLRGATDPQLILDWVAINRRLYEFSEQFPDPREVCNSFSYGGPLFFMKTILGDTYDLVRAGIDWHDEQIIDSLYEGIRMAQDICFCRDWSVFEPVIHQDDPFGRPKKNIPGAMAGLPVFTTNHPISEEEMKMLLEGAASAHPNNPASQVVYTPYSPSSLSSLAHHVHAMSPPAPSASPITTATMTEWFTGQSSPEHTGEYEEIPDYDPDFEED